MKIKYATLVRRKEPDDIKLVPVLLLSDFEKAKKEFAYKVNKKYDWSNAKVLRLFVECFGVEK